MRTSEWKRIAGKQGPGRALPATLLLAVFLCGLARPTAAAESTAVSPTAPKIRLDLTPTYASDGAADGIAVEYTVHGLPRRGALELAMDSLAPSLERGTDVVTDLKVSDCRGELPVGGPAARAKGAGAYEVWTSSRPPCGDVTVAYRVPAARAKARKRGAHVDLQKAGGGISGAYIGFLLLPVPGETRYDAQVHWHMQDGQQAVTSYGVNDYAGAFSASSLGDTLFLAGKVQESPPGDGAGKGGIRVYALGISPGQLRTLGQWTGKAYAAEKRAFKDGSDLPYRFLIRSFDGGGPHSGRAAKNSFLLYLPSGADPASGDLRSLVAHEMVHSLTRWLTADATRDDDDWYGEGAADYFALVIPHAAGLYSDAEYLDLVRRESAGYYTNALRSIPNSEIPAKMWSGRNAWMLPYNRGALYFADLDAKLQARRPGVSVLDLVNEVSAKVDRGEPTSDGTWTDILRRRAGAWAVDDWRKMMAGSIVFPAPGAFGPCVASHRVQTKIFDLGFPATVRLARGARISGVAPGSPAQRAGLRDGDVLASDADIAHAIARPGASVTLKVERAGTPVDITYEPYWHPAPGVAWTWTCP
jgi:predicted metalloprotease with PDZ domain